jgi:hypothetical protein
VRNLRVEPVTWLPPQIQEDFYQLLVPLRDRVLQTRQKHWLHAGWNLATKDEFPADRAHLLEGLYSLQKYSKLVLQLDIASFGFSLDTAAAKNIFKHYRLNSEPLQDFLILNHNKNWLPIGPEPVKIIHEAALTLVDAVLSEKKCKWIRMVDDFSFAVKNRDEALYIIKLISLSLNQLGFSLNHRKSRLISWEEFNQNNNTDVSLECAFNLFKEKPDTPSLEVLFQAAKSKIHKGELPEALLADMITILPRIPEFYAAIFPELLKLLPQLPASAWKPSLKKSILNCKKEILPHAMSELPHLWLADLCSHLLPELLPEIVQKNHSPLLSCFAKML